MPQEFPWRSNTHTLADSPFVILAGILLKWGDKCKPRKYNASWWSLWHFGWNRWRALNRLSARVAWLLNHLRKGCGKSCSCGCCWHYSLLEESVGDRTHVLSLYDFWWLKLEKKLSIKCIGLHRATTPSYSFCLFISTRVCLSMEGWVKKRSKVSL